MNLQVQPDDDGELEIGVFDISRAHFMAKAQRELYIEIPNEFLSRTYGRKLKPPVNKAGPKHYDI